MPISQHENDLLTRVEHDAPMGAMIRQNYWIPAVPSSLLLADGAPVRIRLLGQNYVAFRATDGSVGVLDEQCVHRKASLALAKNENNSLRCLFHAWAYNTQGEVIAAPNHTGDQGEFCKKLRVNRYRAADRGGIVWAWLAKGQTADSVAPPFPALPFVDLPADQRSVTSVEVPTNWVQAVEASMDSSHVGVLHESTTQITAGGGNERLLMTKALAPKLEFEDRPFGYRYAALRGLPDGQVYARVNHFVMPWFGIICPPDANGPTSVFFSTPVDDVTHRAWFVHYNPNHALGMTIMSATPDVWNFPPLPPGTASNNWGQNRDLMKRGHATGFPQHLGTEDFAMFLSQGPIHDRTDEQLCTADGAVIRVRRLLLKAAQDFAAGKPHAHTQAKDLDYASAQSVGGVLPAGGQWRALVNVPTALPTATQSAKEAA